MQARPDEEIVVILIYTLILIIVVFVIHGSLLMLYFSVGGLVENLMRGEFKPYEAITMLHF